MHMTPIENQREYWNKVSEKKNFTHPLNITELNKYVKRNDRVLDYGCGYGRILDELHDKGFSSLIGFDFSENMISRAKREHPHLNVLKSEDAKIPLGDDSLDAIILFGVLTCIPENKKQDKLIREIKRTLKPEGIIYISDYLINDDVISIKRYNKFKDKFGVYGIFELPEGVIVRHYSEKRIDELTKYFSKLWFEKFEVTTMNGNKSNAYQYIGKLIL